MIAVPSTKALASRYHLMRAMLQQQKFVLKAALFPVRGAKQFIEVYGRHQLVIKLAENHYHVAFEANPEQVALKIPQKDVATNVAKLMQWVTRIHELTQIKPEPVAMKFD